MNRLATSTLALLAALSVLTILPLGCTCGSRGGAIAGRGSAVVIVDPDEVGRPEPLPEKEPNDTAKQAQELSRERGVEGSLSEGDRDWYKVMLPPASAPSAPGKPAATPPPKPSPKPAPKAAPKPAPAAAPPAAPPTKGEPAASRPASAPAAQAEPKPLPPVHILSATLSGVADADLILEAWSEKHKRLVRINNSGAGEGEVMVNLAVEGGTIFLLVREAQGQATSGRYRLTYSVRPAEAGEEREPNWKASLASQLPLEGEAIGYLGWKADNDWYRVDVSGLERSARLRVEYDGLDEVRASLSVRSAKAVLQERWGGAGEAIALSNLAVGEGQKELFVVVRTHTHFNVESRYSVRVISSVPPGPTEAEPNDSPALASPITLGAQIAGLLGDTHDRDIYALKVTQPIVVKAEVIPPLNLDAALAILDESGRVVWEVDAGRAREPEVMPYIGVRPPRALFQVRAPRAASVSPVTPYQIKVSAVGEGNFEREPNADQNAATPWPATMDQLAGAIHPRGDVDWFRVAVVGDRLRLRAESRKLKLKLEVFATDGTARGSALSDAAGMARLDIPAEAGSELLLKVSEASNKAAALEPYRLMREKQ